MNTTTTHEECPLCRCFFEEPTGDPWRDLLEPALLDVPSVVDERLPGLAAEADPVHRSRCQAVAARALLALDRPRTARALLDAALTGPAREGWTLEAVVGDTEQALERLLATGHPGLRADAACDGALAALRAGDTDGARGWIVRALQLCPDHAEAERWAAYLEDAGERAAPLFWSFDKPDPELVEVLLQGRKDDPLMAHVDDLVPRASQGTFSRERTVRRLRHFRPGRPAPLGSGLDRLRQAGRTSRWLGCDGDYAVLGADHPQVEVELALDRARALQSWDRSAWPAAEAAWRLAPALTPPKRVRLVALLTLLALRESRLLGLADHATMAVLDEFPRDPLAEAARAATLVADGRMSEGVALGKGALKSYRKCGLALVLALEGLRRAGATRTVRRALRKALHHPDHGWLADVWLIDLELPPLEDAIWDQLDLWAPDRDDVAQN